MTDIDNQLRRYAERWRTAQPPPPKPLLVTSLARWRRTRLEHPGRLLAIAATAAIVVAATVAYAVTRHQPSTSVSTAQAAEVPVAKPPLVFSSQPPPRFITLTNGLSANNLWKFTAAYLPTETSSGLGPGLCLLFDTTAGVFLGCDNPATTPSLTANIVPQQSDPSTLLIAGMTSAPAVTFTVTLGTVSLTTSALTTPALAGLYFYVVQVPAADYQPSRGVAVEALSADGAGLLRNDPGLTVTLQPAR
ncbi:MAG: hypothetical protein M0Z30_19625 [Actinomycetota bacterium]|nr:hypothetical protein [Actinomycetota bacterium]